MKNLFSFRTTTWRARSQWTTPYFCHTQCDVILSTRRSHHTGSTSFSSCTFTTATSHSPSTTATTTSARNASSDAPSRGASCWCHRTCFHTNRCSASITGTPGSPTPRHYSQSLYVRKLRSPEGLLAITGQTQLQSLRTPGWNHETVAITQHDDDEQPPTVSAPAPTTPSRPFRPAPCAPRTIWWGTWCRQCSQRPCRGNQSEFRWVQVWYSVQFGLNKFWF